MLISQCVYDVAQTEQGEILVAECTASSRIVAIFFIDDNQDDLIEELYEMFPEVEFVRGKPTQMDKVINSVNALDSTVKLKMVHRESTAFSMKVYQAIQKIPKGETRTYAEIAREIEQPKAFRAVARACGQNNLAFIVPCHRVISSTGFVDSSTGFVDRTLPLEDISNLSKF